jgi:hypothetical protein
MINKFLNKVNSHDVELKLNDFCFSVFGKTHIDIMQFNDNMQMIALSMFLQQELIKQEDITPTKFGLSVHRRCVEKSIDEYCKKKIN